MMPYRKRNSPFTKRMAEDMRVRNFSPRTIDAYTYHVDRFAKHFGKDPRELGPDEIRQFQRWMIEVNQSSWQAFNQAVCGLRFFYRTTHPQMWTVSMVPYGKRPKKLPTVLSHSEVERLIACVHVPKHRTILLTLYAVGLRTYWKIDRPAHYLFPGKKPEHVLKYLARYMTGGPIGTSRIVSDNGQNVRFEARSRDKTKPRQIETVCLPGVEFVRRWAMHILPKYLTKTRCFGAWSNRRRRRYLTHCQTRCGASQAAASTAGNAQPSRSASEPSSQPTADKTPPCPHCHRPTQLVSIVNQPSWREVFQKPSPTAWFP
jgi:hypothetical protein